MSHSKVNSSIFKPIAAGFLGALAIIGGGLPTVNGRAMPNTHLRGRPRALTQIAPAGHDGLQPDPHNFELSDLLFEEPIPGLISRSALPTLESLQKYQTSPDLAPETTSPELTNEEFNKKFDDESLQDSEKLDAGLEVVKTEGYKATFDIPKNITLIGLIEKNFPEVPWKLLIPTQNGKVVTAEKHSHYVKNAQKAISSEAFFDAIQRCINEYVESNELPTAERRDRSHEISRLNRILGLMQTASRDGREAYERMTSTHLTEDAFFAAKLEEAPASPSPESQVSQTTPVDLSIEAKLEAALAEAAAKKAIKPAKYSFNETDLVRALRTIDPRLLKSDVDTPLFSDVFSDIQKINPEHAQEIQSLLITISASVRSDDPKVDRKANEKLVDDLAKLFVKDAHLETGVDHLSEFEQLATKILDLNVSQPHYLAILNAEKQKQNGSVLRGLLAGTSLFTLAGLALASKAMAGTRNKVGNVVYTAASQVGTSIVNAAKAIADAGDKDDDAMIEYGFKTN